MISIWEGRVFREQDLDLGFWFGVRVLGVQVNNYDRGAKIIFCKKNTKNVKQPRRWRDCGGKREFPWDRGWNVTIPKGSTPWMYSRGGKVIFCWGDVDYNLRGCLHQTFDHVQDIIICCLRLVLQQALDWNDEIHTACIWQIVSQQKMYKKFNLSSTPSSLDELLSVVRLLELSRNGFETEVEARATSWSWTSKLLHTDSFSPIINY